MNDVHPKKLIVIILSNMALNLCNRFIDKKIPLDIRLRMIEEVGQEVRDTFINSWGMLENLRGGGGEGMSCH